jgi:hypothetical protein
MAIEMLIRLAQWYRSFSPRLKKLSMFGFVLALYTTKVVRSIIAIIGDLGSFA